MESQAYDFIFEREMGHWWYRVRRNFVMRLVQRSTGTHSKPVRILDVGCGTGALLSELNTVGEAYGVDISEKAIEYCRRRGLSRLEAGDATCIPFGDNMFDVVVMLDVLEHVRDDRAAACEILRVLKPGGTAIVTVPAYMILWGITDVLSQHFRRYTRSEFVSRLTGVGLQIEYSSYFNTLLFPPIATIRILARILSWPMKSEQNLENRFTNFILNQIFLFETRAMPWIRFPFGVSIVAIARKP